MIVLGIDPGLERMGFGVVEKQGSRIVSVEYGVIKTPPGPLGNRLVKIERDVEALIQRAGPDALVTERLFFAKNSTTAMDVAKALGVALCVGARHGLETREITPPEVKKAVTGQGNADKRQVQFMVTRLLGLTETPKPDDAADALAVAIAGCLHGLPPSLGS
ncbi:MAG: crossover junction endodeoxyribonuclease RuvC [Fimbriimonadaceae bacterium]|nr:crossover junction endodeoxyribonuclease RuvC [Fimbriimonadaceae bacterium]